MSERTLIRACILGAATLFSGGCSSAPAAPEAALNGTYEAADLDLPNGGAPAGPYVLITFSAATSEYALWKTVCPAGGDNPCFESGKFTWNGAHDTLTLTSDAGEATSMPASALPPVDGTSPEAKSLRLDANGSLVSSRTQESLAGESAIAAGVRVGNQTLTSNSAVELVAYHFVKGLRVLLLPFPYPTDSTGTTHCFESNADSLGVWYRAHGAITQSVTMWGRPDSLFTILETAQSDGASFDRVITLAHGGVDGPVFDDGLNQIGLDWPNMGQGFYPRNNAGDPGNQSALVKLGALLQAVTKPSGFVFFGQCRPANPSTIDFRYTYLELMSCLSGRTTYGTVTISACWDITRRVEALDGPQAALTSELVGVNPANVPTPPTNPGPFVCAHGATPPGLNPAAQNLPPQ